MVKPTIDPGIKQCHDIPGLWIDPGEIGALFQIAARARESEIGPFSSPAMASRDDVIHENAVRNTPATVGSTRSGDPLVRERTDADSHPWNETRQLSDAADMPVPRPLGH